MWSAGNRWGLGGDSATPGDVGDALANGYLLALAARSTGGQLWGMTVRSYNVQNQGLFGDSDPAPYPRDTLFDRLCAAFSDWRAIMEGTGGQARLLVWVPDDWMQMHLGTTRQAVRDSRLGFGYLLPLIRANVPLAVMGTLA